MGECLSSGNESTAQRAADDCLVRLTAVAAAYRDDAGGGRSVVGPIDLCIAKGEIVALVAPSGAGKSTLLRIVAGVTPAQGQISFAAPPPKIGFAPQAPSLLPWLSMIDNVLLPMRLGPETQDPQARRDQGLDLLHRFGLAGYEHMRPPAMSGGMQSRCVLARALIGEPDLLLLDEPFGSLDDATAIGILGDLSVHLNGGCAALLVSHNLTQAVFLADRLIVCAADPLRVVAEVRVLAGQPRPRDFWRSPVLRRALEEVQAAMQEATP